MTPSNNTTAFQNNDNSNPQQGTGVKPPLLEQGTMKAPTKNGNETVSGGANTNTMRSPPTKKDFRKLFVGGLPADITEDEFRVFFEQFGEVVDSVVMFDRETHRSRGFGFVTFQSPDVANTLLNMGDGEGEREVGAAETAESAPRVGRLVMRGKTCEVKSAEPKESSRPNRRSYQNQGSSGSSNRRFVDKGYSQPNHPIPVPVAGPYHDPHYMAGHHYPMVAHPYYAAYHPGMYHGGPGYHPAPMYAPVPHAAAMHTSDGLHQPYAAPGGVPAVEGGHVAPYMDGSHETGHYYASYCHPQMMQAAYPPHTHAQPPKSAPATYPAPGPPSSAMHPAAPGLPTKDE